MSREALARVVADARTLLARRNNDVAWSHWMSGTEALAEIEDILGRIEAGDTTDLPSLKTLFAPTSSLQEVGIASGWGDTFLKLASRFDAATADL